MFYVLIPKHRVSVLADGRGNTWNGSGSGLQSYGGCAAVATLLLDGWFSKILQDSGRLSNHRLALTACYGFSPIM